jgi:hypothetical protein
MAEKINSKRFWLAALWLFLIGLLVYTRFVNLGWGLPNPMHPDERNMADSIIQLGCKLPDVVLNLPESISGKWDIFTWIRVSDFDLAGCFDPNFYAYGQFPLYLGYLLTFFIKFVTSNFGTHIGFSEATIALRIISASSSVLTVFYLSKLVSLFFEHKHIKTLAAILTAVVVIFSPYAIQFAHFGTTESLLMLFYSMIVYLSVKLISGKIDDLSYVTSVSVIMGLSIATKVSAAVFMIVPFMAVFASGHSRLHYPFWYGLVRKIIDCGFLVVFSAILFLFFSPHTLINWNDFSGALKYESGVALGQYLVFYTRQFIDSAPVLFQMEKVFPYALGMVVFILSVLGFFGLNWSNPKINFLRLSFLSYFLTSAFMFAKWSRFMAPVFPIMTVFAVLFVLYLAEKNKTEKWIYAIKSFFLVILVGAMIIPGIAYLSIYEKPDVRYVASEWIYSNIPEYSYILSETANVVDIPLSVAGNNLNYKVISFNFYDLDQDQSLQMELIEHLNNAEYIFVPSRRLFANHRSPDFPLVERYYEDLISGKLGFEKIAEFTSYPKIAVAGITLIEFPDEDAEETWTVFDHPVIRVYKKS